MATTTRRPFAPLDGARLQTLTNLKNRQNAVSTGPTKRKAEEVDTDDSENVDPTLFGKRAKGNDVSKDGDFMKSPFILTRATCTPPVPKFNTPNLPASSLRARTVLQPKSPAAKLNTTLASSSMTAPAGRSPTRGSKRIGILSKRRTTRAPPAFGLSLGSATPFSLDAALKGTIPSYSGRKSSVRSADILLELPTSQREPELKSNWDFEIHEDTAEQEMTNLLQHSTCTLDISSDEESEQRATRERAEGRDKENIPPADDVSQVSRTQSVPANEDDMIVEKTRGPLSEMNAADYYGTGCDLSSIIIIPGDDDADGKGAVENAQAAPFDVTGAACQPVLVPVPEVHEDELSIESVMGSEMPSEKASLLVPLEGAEESFDLWESGSSKDDTDSAAVLPETVSEALAPEL